jgi:16S rRNA processing protein RimM
MNVPDLGPLLEVGRIDKPHGVRGEVVVSLITDRVERVAVGTTLYAGDARRPLLIESSKRHQARWIVQFEGVHSREAADELHGSMLRATPLDLGEGAAGVLWIHELIGSTVVDARDGRDIGVVESVEDNPASDLLVLAKSGALIPLRFVVDSSPGRLVVELPEGLLDP